MRYAYEVLEKGLDAFVGKLNSPAATRALRRMKFQVLAIAWTECDIWKPGVDREEALAYAWQDLDIALRGYGDSAITGAIIHFWMQVGEENWAAGMEALNKAGMDAWEATPKSVPRRYVNSYRIRTVRTPAMGFDLPAIIPAFGVRLREWATQGGLDPDEVENKMSLVEEYERLGLIDLGSEFPVPTSSGPHLRLVGSEEP